MLKTETSSLKTTTTKPNLTEKKLSAQWIKVEGKLVCRWSIK